MKTENNGIALASSLPKSVMAYAHPYAKAWFAEHNRGETALSRNGRVRTYADYLKMTLGLFWHELRQGRTEFIDWDTTC